MIFVVQYGGFLYFHRALTGKTSVISAIIFCPLLYSYIFNWGFANFLLGLGLVFWAAGWWLSERRRPAVALPVACLLAVLIFLVHGLAFALYGILVGSLELGLFLASPDRRLGALARSVALLLVQAIIPVVLFKLSPTIQAAGGVTNAGASAGHLFHEGRLAARLWELFQYRLITIFRVEESRVPWFDVATFLAQIVIIGLLIWRGGASIVRAAWPSIAVGAMLVLLTPPAMFHVGYIADRMPLFLAFLTLGALDLRLDSGAESRVCAIALAVIVAARLVVIGMGWIPYQQDYREFQAVAAKIPPGSMVSDLMVASGRHETNVPRCEMYEPLLISLYGQVGLLFSDETQQPLRLVGALRKAGEIELANALKWEKSPPAHPYEEIIRAAGPAGFQYLLVCNQGLLRDPLAPGVTVVARTPRFMLLRVGG
jgi:hypothetical protein